MSIKAAKQLKPIKKKKLAPSTLKLRTLISETIAKFRVRNPQLISEIELDLIGSARPDELPEIDTSKILEPDRHLIRSSFSREVGSCGVVSFVGTYKIISTAYAAAIIEEWGKGRSDIWNYLLLCATTHKETPLRETFLTEAGWERVKEFGHAHCNGKMTLWAVYKDGGKHDINEEGPH